MEPPVPERRAAMTERSRAVAPTLALVAVSATPTFAESPPHPDTSLPASEAAARLEAAFLGLPGCDPSSDAASDHRIFDTDLPGEDGAARPIAVGLFACRTGAYNVTHVVLTMDGDRVEIASLPHVEVAPARVPPDEDASPERPEITGIGASIHASNAEFDPTVNRLSAHHRLRGLGDASTFTTWRLTPTGFVLETHDVDLAFDGESNFRRVVEGGRPVTSFSGEVVGD